MIAAAAVTVLLGVGGAAAAYLAFLQPEPEAPTPHALPAPFPTPAPTAAPKPKSKPKPDRFQWRQYGYTLDHRRWFNPPTSSLRGPFVRIWRRKAPALLEFPPVMSNGSLFQLADNGQLRSMHKKNGKTRWQKKLGRLAASSPALDKHRIYVTLLDGGSAGRGRIVAMLQRNGHRRWSRTRPTGRESPQRLPDGRLS